MTDKLVHIDNEYKQWIADICQRFRQSQIKAAVKVNSEMLRFYWSLGKDIVSKKIESRYGDGVIKRISNDLKAEFPDIKGFSPTNISYIKRFYLLYNQLVENHPQLVGCPIEEMIFNIPWGHHHYIIDKCYSNPSKALFYVQKTLKNGLSRNMLLNLLDTDLYEREGMAVSNFDKQLPPIQSDLAKQITRDPYNFDFLTIREPYEEKELKNELVKNIERFLIEMGAGFAYMGREFRLQVGQTEQFLDMLFYNTRTHSYVVVEIKTRKFESADVGQLGTYVLAVDDILKTPIDNPTIGLLICKEKDSVLAKYALGASAQPLGISEYQLGKVLPENYRSSLPSIEEIERELSENL